MSCLGPENEDFQQVSVGLSNGGAKFLFSSNIDTYNQIDDFPRLGGDFRVNWFRPTAETNIFQMEVEYTGGCGDHNFFLYSPGQFIDRPAGSDPVPARFLLAHINFADPCADTVVFVIERINLSLLGRGSYELTIENTYSGEVALSDVVIEIE